MALNEDTPAVSLNHTVYDGKSQPAAFGGAIRTLVEALEDMWQLIGADARRFPRVSMVLYRWA